MHVSLTRAVSCWGPPKTASPRFGQPSPNTFESLVAVVVLRAGDLDERVPQVVPTTGQHLRHPVLILQAAPAQETPSNHQGDEERGLEPPPWPVLPGSALLGTAEGTVTATRKHQR